LASSDPAKSKNCTKIGPSSRKVRQKLKKLTKQEKREFRPLPPDRRRILGKTPG